MDASPLVELLPRVRLEGAFGIADPSAQDGGKFSVLPGDAVKLVAQGVAVRVPARKAKGVKPTPKSEG